MSAFERKTLLFRLALLSLLISCAATFAMPQEEETKDLTTLSLEDLLRVKVYTASRHLEDSAKAPSAVSIITAEEIRRYGWRTLGEALRSLRGFYTAYDRDYTYLGVRGMQRPGDYNSRILLLVNGHRINENVYDSAAFGGEFPLDLDTVERIEVVRGPSSSLFGSNAIFGVINVITRQPEQENLVEACAQTGSFLGRAGRLTTSFNNKHIAGIVSGTWNRSNGHEQLYFPEFDFPETNHGLAQNLDGESLGQFFADLHLGNVRVQGLFSDRAKTIPTAAFESNFNSPGTFSKDIGGYIDVSFRRAISSTTELDLRTYYDSYRSEGAGITGDLEGLPAYKVLSTGDADWLGMEATVGRQIGSHRLTFGGQYEYSLRIAQKFALADLPPIAEEEHTMSMLAGYSQVELKLASKLSLNAGARIDWFNEFGVSLSPRVALLYAPQPGTSLKYVFGRAFRVPNAYESRYEDRIVMAVPKVPLDPEIITSHDVVFEQRFNPWLQFTAEYFYNGLTRLIEQELDPDDGLWRFVNSGQSKGRGLEFQVEAKRRSGFSARASYSLADADDSIREVQMANTPVNMVKANVTLPLRKKLYSGIELLYSSSQETSKGTHVPPYLLANVTLSSGRLFGRWEMSASCYNVLNRKWYLPAGTELRQNRIEQDGRAFRIKVMYRLPIGEKATK